MRISTRWTIDLQTHAKEVESQGNDALESRNDTELQAARKAANQLGQRILSEKYGFEYLTVARKYAARVNLLVERTALAHVTQFTPLHKFQAPIGGKDLEVTNVIVGRSEVYALDADYVASHGVDFADEITDYNALRQDIESAEYPNLKRIEINDIITFCLEDRFGYQPRTFKMPGDPKESRDRLDYHQALWPEDITALAEKLQRVGSSGPVAEQLGRQRSVLKGSLWTTLHLHHETLLEIVAQSQKLPSFSLSLLAQEKGARRILNHGERPSFSLGEANFLKAENTPQQTLDQVIKFQLKIVKTVLERYEFDPENPRRGPDDAYAKMHALAKSAGMVLL